MDPSRWIPALRWLPAYDRILVRGDFVAGITLAAYLLPAALGDASLANLPPQAGLYACLFSGLVFWLFCSSRHTAITVTSAISLLVGASLAEIAGGDATRFGALAAGTAVLVAVIALIAWAVRAGAIVSFISESVMVGFKCGVALFLASTQLPKLFGLHGAHGDFWENTRELHRSSATRPISLRSRSGLAALTILILGKIFLKHKPVALFVVIGGISPPCCSASMPRASSFSAKCRKACQPSAFPIFTGPTSTRCSRSRSLASCWLPSRRLPSAAPLPPSMAGASMPTRSSSLWLRQTSPRDSAAASR